MVCFTCITFYFLLPDLFFDQKDAPRKPTIISTAPMILLEGEAKIAIAFPVMPADKKRIPPINPTIMIIQEIAPFSLE